MGCLSFVGGNFDPFAILGQGTSQQPFWLQADVLRTPLGPRGPRIANPLPDRLWKTIFLSTRVLRSGLLGSYNSKDSVADLLKVVIAGVGVPSSAYGTCCAMPLWAESSKSISGSFFARGLGAMTEKNRSTQQPSDDPRRHEDKTR